MYSQLVKKFFVFHRNKAFAVFRRTHHVSLLRASLCHSSYFCTTRLILFFHLSSSLNWSKSERTWWQSV